MEDFFKLAGNYFFPMVLSIYLVVKIDKLITTMVTNQAIFQAGIMKEIKDIKTDIYNIRIDMAKKKC